MKKMLWLLVLSTLLAGCDGFSKAQLLVRPPSNHSETSFTVPADEQAQVREVLLQVATDRRFADITEHSRVPNTLASYKENVEHFPVYFGARVAGDMIVVDLGQFRPGSRDTDSFTATREQLRHLLSLRFGSRLAESPRDAFIPIPQ